MSNPLGAHPELFGPFYALAFLASYVTAVVVGYRRGWPPAAWLLVLAAAGIGGVVGTRLLPLGLDGLRALLAEGALPDGGARRIPGTILGALVAAEAARRLLGVRQSLLDPLAYGGLVGLAVVRLGCLAAGCCFGTPTALPWGATYAAGSTVHGFHLAHGVAGAAPLPVHPVPLYDVVFAVLVLAALPHLARRLRAPGSLCGATVGLYAAWRFAQEFLRADGVDAAGGLTAVQGGMAVAVVLTALWVTVAERRARRQPAVGLGDEEPGLARLALVLGVLVAARVGLGDWLTPSESAVLLVRLLPAAAAVGIVAWRSAAAPHVRWAAGALAAALPAVVGFQTTAPADTLADGPFRAWAVEAHGGLGRYEEFEICSPDLLDYRTAGAGLAYVRADPAAETVREVGVRAYGTRQELAQRTTRPGEPGPADVLALHPYYSYEGPRVGVRVGAQVGRLPLLGVDDDGPVLPAVGVRFGKRKFHVEGGFLDGPHVGAPAPAFYAGFGTGRLTERGQEARWRGGVSGSGVYLSGAFAADDLLVEPWAAFGPSSEGSVYHAGLRLRYQFPAE